VSFFGFALIQLASASSMRESNPPYRRMRDATRSGWTASRSVRFIHPHPGNWIGFYQVMLSYRQGRTTCVASAVGFGMITTRSAAGFIKNALARCGGSCHGHGVDSEQGFYRFYAACRAANFRPVIVHQMARRPADPSVTTINVFFYALR